MGKPKSRLNDHFNSRYFTFIKGGQNLPPLIGIGLTDLPKRGDAPGSGIPGETKDVTLLGRITDSVNTTYVIKPPENRHNYYVNTK